MNEKISEGERMEVEAKSEKERGCYVVKGKKERRKMKVKVLKIEKG